MCKCLLCCVIISGKLIYTILFIEVNFCCAVFDCHYYIMAAVIKRNVLCPRGAIRR